MRRGAGLWAGAAALMALSAAAQDGRAAALGEVVAARFAQPTGRYAHGVFGDPLEWGALVMALGPCTGCAPPRLRQVTIKLPQARVFEDTEARVADLDGDGHNEVIVVETDVQRGASLAIYDASGKRAATAFIGQSHRWLAPAGVGDFDGDGRIEIAFVDRPHLTRELVFLRYDRGALSEIARAAGFTNHRFGDARISGGLRRCGGRDSLILATADWARRVEVTLQGGVPQVADLGPLSRVQDLGAALVCP